jgi:hypothetical protein
MQVVAWLAWVRINGAEIARLGGRAAHRKGVVHEITSLDANAVGRIGEQNSHIRKRALREQGMAAQMKTPDILSDAANDGAAPVPAPASTPSSREE